MIVISCSRLIPSVSLFDSKSVLVCVCNNRVWAIQGHVMPNEIVMYCGIFFFEYMEHRVSSFFFFRSLQIARHAHTGIKHFHKIHCPPKNGGKRFAYLLAHGAPRAVSVLCCFPTSFSSSSACLMLFFLWEFA